MQVTITITCDNQAFDDNQGGEVARILMAIAEKLAYRTDLAADDDFWLHDINGNKVGTFVPTAE